tara:strand:- start:25 stop:234 length:210 start_codon:yes stop_codon:yes gene_type:complete
VINVVCGGALLFLIIGILHKTFQLVGLGFVLGVDINMKNLMKKFQSSSAVEQKTVNLFVVGSIPTSGAK